MDSHNFTQKYTLFKQAISEGDCKTTQQIVRFVHNKWNVDMRPTNIIEREYPEQIKGCLPSIFLWENKEYILGGELVLEWYYENVKVYQNEETTFDDFSDFISKVKLWDQQNPDYRINDNLKKTSQVIEPAKQLNWEISNTNEVITFMSLNLWNDRFRMEHRFAKFCEVVNNIEPDVICLQEVNQAILQKLLLQDWTKSYFKSAHKIDANRPCGEIILSKFPILKKESFPFNNTMSGQHVHIAHIQIPLNYFQNKFSIDKDFECMSFPVITSQLEKLKGFEEVRRQQMTDLFGMVSKIPTSFLLIDTNITDEHNDSITVPDGWKDAYEENKDVAIVDENEESGGDSGSDNSGNLDENTNTNANTNINEFTYDSEKNLYIGGYQKFRYDRLFYKSTVPNVFGGDEQTDKSKSGNGSSASNRSGGWKCVDFQIVCNDIPVSTHFGIFATFHLI